MLLKNRHRGHKYELSRRFETKETLRDGKAPKRPSQHVYANAAHQPRITRYVKPSPCIRVAITPGNRGNSKTQNPQNLHIFMNATKNETC